MRRSIEISGEGVFSGVGRPAVFGDERVAAAVAVVAGLFEIAVAAWVNGPARPAAGRARTADLSPARALPLAPS